MDRRIINRYYSAQAMDLFLALAQLCREDSPVKAGVPVVLGDGITFMQTYEHQPLDSGSEVYWRLSEDLQHVLVFDPEVISNVANAEYPGPAEIERMTDDQATGNLPMTDTIASQIHSYMVGL